MTFADWSSTVAVSCWVEPATSEADAGVTLTLVTTGVTGGGGGARAVTVIAEPPDLPPAVAEIVADPADAAVTKPVAFTVATLELLDDQLTVWPATTDPCASRARAVNCCVPPTIRLAEAGVTCTLDTTGAATCAVTVTVVCVDTPPAVALITAPPAAPLA